MTIYEVQRELERRVLAGKVKFARRRIPSVSGHINFWIETIYPEYDTSPLEYLSEAGFLDEDPPHGLSWDDYIIMVEACDGSKGEKDPHRRMLVESCKAQKKIDILRE